MAALNVTQLLELAHDLARFDTNDLLIAENYAAQRAGVRTEQEAHWMNIQNEIRAILVGRGVRTRFIARKDLSEHEARRTERHMFELYDRDGYPVYITSMTTEDARALRDRLIAANLG